MGRERGRIRERKTKYNAARERGGGGWGEGGKKGEREANIRKGEFDICENWSDSI